MNKLSMEYRYGQRDPSRRYQGAAVVVAVHALIAWALISGMGVRLVPLHKLAPAVPVWVDLPALQPPKPVEQIKPPKPVEPPRDTFVPEPEVMPTETTAISMDSTPEPSPESTAAPADASPLGAAAAASASDMQVACPNQVAPQIPRRALQDGATGTVRALAQIQNGRVRQVTILSGPRIFHQPVIDAMLQYRCTASAGDLSAVQEFKFRVE